MHIRVGVSCPWRIVFGSRSWSRIRLHQAPHIRFCLRFLPTWLLSSESMATTWRRSAKLLLLLLLKRLGMFLRRGELVQLGPLVGSNVVGSEGLKRKIKKKIEEKGVRSEGSRVHCGRYVLFSPSAEACGGLTMFFGLILADARAHNAQNEVGKG